MVSVAISLYAVFGGILRNFPSFAQQPINDAGAQIRIFESVLQHIQNDYVDEPNLEKFEPVPCAVWLTDSTRIHHI
jgi:hypothetical protein